MIRGHVDISHITYDMLEELVFTEKTKTREAGGYWKTLGTVSYTHLTLPTKRIV